MAQAKTMDDDALYALGLTENGLRAQCLAAIHVSSRVRTTDSALGRTFDAVPSTPHAARRTPHATRPPSDGGCYRPNATATATATGTLSLSLPLPLPPPLPPHALTNPRPNTDRENTTPRHGPSGSQARGSTRAAAIRTGCAPRMTLTTRTGLTRRWVSCPHAPHAPTPSSPPRPLAPHALHAPYAPTLHTSGLRGRRGLRLSDGAASLRSPGVVQAR